MTPIGVEPVELRILEAVGPLVRLWRRPLVGDGTTAIGLYRAFSQAQLEDLLAALPLADWLRVTVTPLEAHPNDPATVSR
jgi:muconolactone D-isomerase